MAFVPNWSPTAYYNEGDKVIYINTTYTLIVPGNTDGVFGVPPPSNPAAWLATVVATGNWSYKGIWAGFAPPTGGYKLNDVVFDPINTTETYICKSAYTPTGSSPPPSFDNTHWLLFAINTAPVPVAGVTSLNTLNGVLNILSRQSGLNNTINVATGITPATISIWTPQLIQFGTSIFSSVTPPSLPIALTIGFSIPYATPTSYIVIATINDNLQAAQPTFISLITNNTENTFTATVNTLAAGGVDWVINYFVIGPNPIA